MTIYSVSYCMSARDNGHCVSYQDRASAEACYRELIRDGAFEVRLWSSDEPLIASFYRGLQPSLPDSFGWGLGHI